MNRNESMNTVVDAMLTAEPTVEIKHFALAGSGLARIVARVVHTAKSRVDANLVRSAIAKKFDNQLEAVAGSFSLKDRGPVSDVITGLVTPRREAIAVASSADMNGFRAIAGNMFLDEEDRIWSLNKTAAGSLLVRTTGIDDDSTLLGMLTATASSVINGKEEREMIATASAVRNNVVGGSYVTFVNANNLVDHGYILATANDNGNEVAAVLPAGADEAQEISVNAVIDVHEISPKMPQFSEEEEMQQNVAVASGRVNLDMLLDYYKKVFAADPSYYEQFATRLKEYSFA